MMWPFTLTSRHVAELAAKDRVIEGMREQRDQYSAKYLSEMAHKHAALDRLDTTYVRVGPRFVRYIDAGLPEPLPPAPEQPA